MSLTEDYRVRVTFHAPTNEQMRAHNRRRSFHEKIASAAAALTQKHLVAAAALKAEAVPAEPDPPVHSEICHRCRAVLDRGERAYPSIAEIQAVVAQFYNVTRADMCSQRRQAYIVLPRQIAMYIAKTLTPFSLPMIARHFGGRDHTTAISAIRKIARLLGEGGAKLASDIEILITALGGRVE